MRLYRSTDPTDPFQWAGDQRAANLQFGRGNWVQVDVPTDKPGLLAWLNEQESQQEGSGGCPLTTGPERPGCDDAGVTAGETASSYTAQSIAIDEAWDLFPLARQLHFASLAMERARKEIGA